MQDKLEETQSFIDALKSLKRRIAPFILRRTKEQVLKELPPKVIQDYPCTMPSLQAEVHLEIEKKFPFAGVTQATPSDGQPKQKQSHLKSQILHLKVCNHPMLVHGSYLSDLAHY
jgi:TATA-binding protein-associated factor